MVFTFDLVKYIISISGIAQNHETLVPIFRHKIVDYL